MTRSTPFAARAEEGVVGDAQPSDPGRAAQDGEDRNPLQRVWHRHRRGGSCRREDPRQLRVGASRRATAGLTSKAGARRVLRWHPHRTAGPSQPWHRSVGNASLRDACVPQGLCRSGRSAGDPKRCQRRSIGELLPLLKKLGHGWASQPWHRSVGTGPWEMHRGGRGWLARPWSVVRSAGFSP